MRTSGIAIMSDDDVEIIMSPLCKTYTENGKSVIVEIYKGVEEKWILEILDHLGNSMISDEMFETDQEAWNQFIHDVKEEGIDSFIGLK